MIISCIGYYATIFFNLVSFETATMVWLSMFIGTILVAVGGDLIRESRERSTAVITIMELLSGILLALIGLLISMLTVIGRNDIFLNYFF